MTDEKDNYVPTAPAGKDDEEVLAGIARKHALSLGIRRAVRRDSPQAAPRAVPSGADLIPPDAPPTAEEGELPAVSEAESPLTDSTGLRETSPKGVFYVRRAICRSQGKPARGKLARGKLARGRLARVLIVYLVSMVVLTVALCFVTWLDGRRNEEFAQTGILVDGGRNSGKTEGPEAETPGHRNTVIVVDR